MACDYFGPVELEDSNAGEILAKWNATCLADKRHPKAKLVRNNVLALYCCDKATDVISQDAAGPKRAARLEYELTLPGNAIVELVKRKRTTLPFGRGQLVLRYLPSDTARA
jgi:hypothetical protein